MTHTAPSAADTEATQVPSKENPAGVVSLFALVGPFVGGLATLVFLLASTRGPIRDAGSLFKLVMAGGYIVGLMPAVLTGLVMANMLNHCRGCLGAAAVGAVLGFAVSLVFGSILWMILESRNGAAVMAGTLMMGCLGGVAGGVCGALAKAVCCAGERQQP